MSKLKGYKTSIVKVRLNMGHHRTYNIKYNCPANLYVYKTFEFEGYTFAWTRHFYFWNFSENKRGMESGIHNSKFSYSDSVFLYLIDTDSGKATHVGYGHTIAHDTEDLEAAFEELTNHALESLKKIDPREIGRTINEFNDPIEDFDVPKLVAEAKAQRELEQQEKAKARAEEELKKELKRQEQFNETKQRFAQGEYVDGQELLQICKNVLGKDTIPLKTQGSLNAIYSIKVAYDVESDKCSMTYILNKGKKMTKNMTSYIYQACRILNGWVDPDEVEYNNLSNEEKKLQQSLFSFKGYQS